MQQFSRLMRQRNTLLIAAAVFALLIASLLWKLMQPPEVKDPVEVEYPTLLIEIEPADGATVSGSEAWVRWSPPAPGKGTVFWRATGAGEFQHVEAGGDDPKIARLAPLKAGKYEYYVESTSEGRTERSPLRTFTVRTGVAFEGEVDVRVERDYDQQVSVKLRNDSGEKVTVAARSLTQHPDLLADFVGYGSADQPAELAPGASIPLQFVVTAPDATRDSYDIPVEAAGASGLVRVRVNRPELKLSFKVVGEDPHSLTKKVEVLNEGATLSDLSVHLVGDAAADVVIQPATTHAYLAAGQKLEFAIAPILYLEFQQVAVNLEASAAGQSMRFPLEFKAPAGVQLMGIRTGTQYHSFSNDFYCTNRPSTCSNLPGPQGNGPVLLASVGSSIPAQTACTPCDIPSACAHISELQELIEKYSDPGTRENPGIGMGVESFKKFAGEFDTIFVKLATSNLACRYDKGNGLPSGVDATLADIRRARVGFKTLDEPLATFPGDTCAMGNDMSSRQREECDDHQAIESIYDELGNLANAIGCPPADKGGPKRRNPCPDIGTFETIQESADRGKKTVDMLEKAAGDSARTNEALKEALEETGGALDKLSGWMGKIIKAGKFCKEVADFLKNAQAFKKAIDDINNAGCDSAKLARGFDDLFRTAGELGQKQPFPQLGPVFDILKENKDFFSNTSGNLNPEQRWERQLSGTDGYIFGCQQP